LKIGFKRLNGKILRREDLGLPQEVSGRVREAKRSKRG